MKEIKIGSYYLLKTCSSKKKAMKTLSRLEKKWDWYWIFSDGYVAKIKDRYHVVGRYSWSL